MTIFSSGKRAAISSDFHPYRVEVIDRTNLEQIAARDGERLQGRGWVTFWDSSTERLILDPRPWENVPLSNEANPILAWFREEHASEPNAYTTHEWLFQLGRHWAEWQDARMGTFPIQMTDPSGPVSRSESEDGGEDSIYWTLDECIRVTLQQNGADITFSQWLPGEREQFSEEQALKIEDDWTWEAPDSDRPNLGDFIQDIIVHAVKVIDRLDDWHTANGRGI